MKNFEQIASLKGEVTPPPDKSITHRAFLLSLMSKGKTCIKNPLISRDTMSTLNAVIKLGASVTEIEKGYIVSSGGYREIKEPNDILDCGNSGTTARLISGVLAPGNSFFVLDGDKSLKKRPMDRVISPLTEMNARIFARENNKKLPMCITPSKMKCAEINAQVKSAQVKSAVLLAACQIEGKTVYTEKGITRNHTEIMLHEIGCNINSVNGKIEIYGGNILSANDIYVPGDFSSAAFFIGAALIFENSEIILKNVGLNESRTGMINVLEEFGIKIDISVESKGQGEKFGDLHIKHQNISGGKISGEIIPNIIDEVPMLAVLGLFAQKPVEIRDAQELRVKESDRISSVAYNLRKIGAKVEEFSDGLKVFPLSNKNNPGELKSFDDHRIAMINILLAKRFGNLSIDDISSIDVSFPGFLREIENLEVNS